MTMLGPGGRVGDALPMSRRDVLGAAFGVAASSFAFVNAADAKVFCACECDTEIECEIEIVRGNRSLPVGIRCTSVSHNADVHGVR